MFSIDETSLGMSNNNIGNANLQKQTLPPQHPKFASTYNNIGTIYDDQGK